MLRVGPLSLALVGDAVINLQEGAAGVGRGSSRGPGFQGTLAADSPDRAARCLCGPGVRCHDPYDPQHPGTPWRGRGRSPGRETPPAAAAPDTDGGAVGAVALSGGGIGRRGPWLPLARDRRGRAARGALAAQDAERSPAWCGSGCHPTPHGSNAARRPSRRRGWRTRSQRCLFAAAILPPAAATQDLPEGRDLVSLIVRFLAAEPQFLQRTAVADPEALAAAIRAFLAGQATTPRDGAPIFPRVEVQGLARIIRQIVNSLDPAPLDAVRSAAERTGQPIEARLAAALASGRLEAVVAKIAQDVRTQIERLRQNDGFAGFLRQTGQQAHFDQATQRVLDRRPVANSRIFAGKRRRTSSSRCPFRRPRRSGTPRSTSWARGEAGSSGSIRRTPRWRSI